MSSAVSERTIDLRHATHVVIQVEQKYRYTYSEPIRDLHHRLMVLPPPMHGDQRLLQQEIGIDGTVDPPIVKWSCDEFGNSVCTVEAQELGGRLAITAAYRVERGRNGSEPGEPAERASIDAASLERYLEQTTLTQPSRPLEWVADRILAESPWPRGRAYRAYHWAAASVVYQSGVTGVQTTAAEALARGVGVCQDFTHILLAVLRLLGIPARYVSGHLPGERAPHAWVEALIPDDTTEGGVRIVGYDPTNHREPGPDYVVVAVGRDFADITPTSGWFSGTARSELAATQSVRVIQADRDREPKATS